jgi:hypothetical protein
MFGNNIIDFNFLVLILTNNIFHCLFSNLLEPPLSLVYIGSNRSIGPSICSDRFIDIASWSAAFSILEATHAERIKDFLANKAGISKMELLARFDLSDQNLKTLVELLGLYRHSDNKYAFSFRTNKPVLAVAEKNIKFWCPVKENKVHLFERKAGFFMEENLSSYFASRNCKSIFIFDPKTKSLFEIDSRLEYVKINNILYISRKSGGQYSTTVYDPYDPQVNSKYKNPTLFLKNKDGGYHKLDLRAELRPNGDNNAGLVCSSCLTFIRTDINKQPVIRKGYFDNNSSLLTVERLKKSIRETRFRVH